MAVRNMFLFVISFCWAVGNGRRPHIISILQDDLGYFDSGVHNPAAAAWSSNITGLARSGVVLNYHYSHWHCSPSRRSFLTGRLPVHHGEQLSPDSGDDIDLRQTWISQKLASAGYDAHWFGKYHTGFRSMSHLPVAHGFSATSAGSLQTGGAYSGPKHQTRWQGGHPLVNDSQLLVKPASCLKQHETSGVVGAGGNDGSRCVDEYSTDLWGALALEAVAAHNASDESRPLYIHLCFQAVHTPYDPAPGDPTGNVYRGMLWRSDVFVGQLVALLKERQMYSNTLILYSSDNGGTGDGNNYPLRGEKHSNWEGGVRVAAFVSGGFVPASVRGTSNNHTVHLVDWYATFSALAGIDPADDPPIAPLPADPSYPYKNIYGEKSFPPVDGVDVWPLITDPDAHPDPAAAHPDGLVLSKEVVVIGRWKLLVSQPHFKTQQLGWKQPNGKWRAPVGSEAVPCMTQDVGPAESALPVPTNSSAPTPCLFDLGIDPGEHEDVSQNHPEVVSRLWRILNVTVAGQRDCSGWSYEGVPGVEIPGPRQPDGSTSCSPPALLGPCDTECSESHWTRFGEKGKPDGPLCGVPGC